MAEKNGYLIEEVKSEPLKFSEAGNSPVGVSPGDADLERYIRLPGKFAAINRMIMRDLNKNTSAPSFFLYTKDDVAKFLKNPYRNEKNLRDAVIYLYGASAHFRRLIQYFVSLNDLNYVVSTYKTDTSSFDQGDKKALEKVAKNYRRVLNLLSSMNIKKDGERILTVCFREDVFYGTFWETSDSIILQQLPSDYCSITTIEDNVPNVTFDFSYFRTHAENLALYPEEFRIKYAAYEKNSGLKWQELDSPNSFAVKVNSDILGYAIPPFAGILREIYDLEDYKGLKLAKTELENYAMLVMKLGLDKDGNWEMDLGKAKSFYHNLDSVLPEEVGSVLSPMPIEKISFERNHTGDTDTIAEAEQNLYTAAGVSSLLFNNPKASAASLLLSIMADQAMTYGVVKSYENVLNRFIHRHGFGKKFKMNFLNSSVYNRKELSDSYLKAAQYGIPTVSYFCAVNGILQDDMDGLNFLEDRVLDIKSRFKPLQSSNTMSGNSNDAGRPLSDIGDLSDSGEVTREEQ